MEEPFVELGSSEADRAIRREIATHIQSAEKYMDLDGHVFRVFDLQHGQCGMALVHFCGVIVETAPNNVPVVLAFRQRSFFEDVYASIASSSIRL